MDDDGHTINIGVPDHIGTPSEPEAGRQAPWIIQLEASPDPLHFGPFVDEDEALGWGCEHLADFEPEEWEPYPLCVWPRCRFKRKDAIELWFHVHFTNHGWAGEHTSDDDALAAILDHTSPADRDGES